MCCWQQNKIRGGELPPLYIARSRIEIGDLAMCLPFCGCTCRWKITIHSPTRARRTRRYTFMPFFNSAVTAFSDSRYRSGRWPRYLGCHQPVGRLRQRQPWRKILGHETADGWWRRDTDRHDSGAAAFWTFWLNYGILKLKGNRIRHNPKKPMKINRSCGL